MNHSPNLMTHLHQLESKLNKAVFAPKNNFISLETVFVLIVLIQGLLFAIFVPPNEVPDEAAHFGRVYNIATGHLFSDQVQLPDRFATLLYKYQIGFGPAKTVNINSYLANFGDEEQDSEKNATKQMGTSVYSPILYFPQLIGLSLGFLFRLNAHWMFLIGRVLSLLFYIGITVTILKTTVFRNSLFIFFSMPMTVYLAASYSSDGVQTALTFLYLHFIVTSIKSANILSVKARGAILLVGSLLSLTKPVSLLLFLLLFAIPTERFLGKRDKITFIVSQFLIMVLLGGGWSASISSYISPLDNNNVLPSRQLLYILLNPIAFIKMLFVTFNQFREFYFYSFIGIFGWLTTGMPDFVYFVFTIGFIAALLSDMGQTLVFTRSQIGAFLAVSALYVMGVVASMYIYWSPLMSSFTQGVQGRYFIPVFPLVIYSLASLPVSTRIFSRQIVWSIILTSSTIFTALFAFQSIYLKYFVPCGEYYYAVTQETCVLPLGLQEEKPEKLVGQLHKPLVQTFVAECNNLNKLALFFVPAAGTQTGSLYVQLIDASSNSTVVNEKIFVPKVGSEKWKMISFSPLTDSKDRRFSLTITPSDNPISAATLGAFTTSDRYLGGELIGADFEGDLIFSYACDFGFIHDLKRLKP